MPLPINFFIKFNELEDIPQLKSIKVNGMPICFNAPEEGPPISVGIQASFGPTEAPAKKFVGISLTDLNLNSFPSITNIPQQVNNVSEWLYFVENYFKAFVLG